MSEQKVPRSVEQGIVIKFLVGENVPSAEIHHRLQQHYGEECLSRRHSLKVAQLLRSAACLHTNQSRSYLNHLVIDEVGEEWVFYSKILQKKSPRWATTTYLL